MHASLQALRAIGVSHKDIPFTDDGHDVGPTTVPAVVPRSSLMRAVPVKGGFAQLTHDDDDE